MVGSFIGKPLPTQKTRFLGMKTRWQSIKSFKAVSFPVGGAASFPHDLSLSSIQFSLLLSLLHERRNACLCYGPHALHKRIRSLNGRCREGALPSVTVCVCACVRVCMSHAIQMARYGGKYSCPFFSRLYKLYITRSKKKLQVSLSVLLLQRGSYFFHFSGVEAQYNPYGRIRL